MLFNIKISSSIHVPANVIFHLSSRLHRIPLVVLSIHSSVGGHIGWFCFLAYKISNKNGCAEYVHKGDIVGHMVLWF